MNDFDHQHGAWADGEIHPVDQPSEWPPEEGMEVPNQLREFAFKRMDDWWVRGLREVWQYQGDRLMALDCFLLAIGQGRMIGCETATDISRRYFGNGRHKFAVTKIVMMFRTILKIKDMPGQRDAQGRASMARAREKQLTNGS